MRRLDISVKVVEKNINKIIKKKQSISKFTHRYNMDKKNLGSLQDKIRYENKIWTQKKKTIIKYITNIQQSNNCENQPGSRCNWRLSRRIDLGVNLA